MVIQLWKSILGMELRNTIRYLSDNLQSIDFLYDGSLYSLLYGIKSNKNKILYYEGQFTLDLNRNIELKDQWNQMPDSIRRFYEDLDFFPMEWVHML